MFILAIPNTFTVYKMGDKILVLCTKYINLGFSVLRLGTLTCGVEDQNTNPAITDDPRYFMRRPD